MWIYSAGRLWVFFLSHTAPGFNCGFISTSTSGMSTGVCSSGCPGGLGSAPVRARCEGGTAAWVAGVLAAPGSQGDWWLGQQEIQCSRRYGNQYCPVHSSILARRTPIPDREAWQATVCSVAKSYKTEATLHARCKNFLPVAAKPVLPPVRFEVKVAQLLGLRGPWHHQACRDMDCLCRRSHGPIRVCF